MYEQYVNICKSNDKVNMFKKKHKLRKNGIP